MLGPRAAIMVEALQTLPKNARGPGQPAAVHELIGKLYAVESRAQRLEMDAQQRLHQRQEHSVPVIEAIEALLLAHLHAVVLVAHGIQFAVAQAGALVQDGRYPIDNILARIR